MTTLAQALAHGHGIERPFTCPSHPDTHPSASVNVVKGKWFCHTCHAHGDVDGSVYDDLNDDLVLPLQGDTMIHPESWLDQFDAGSPCEYWAARFEPTTVAHFRLGYDGVRDAATYPLRDPAGRVLGVVRRALYGGSKYRYPYRARTSDLLFGYDGQSVPTVLLTEGATDAMAAWEAGFTTEYGSVALATYSNRISAAQVRLLARIDPDAVVLCYDDDEAGAAGTAQIAQLLGHDYLLRRASYGGAKDLADLAPQARRDAVEQAIAL